MKNTRRVAAIAMARALDIHVAALKNDLQRQYFLWLETRHPDLFVTIRFNRELPIHLVESAVHQLTARCERHWRGRSWSWQPNRGCYVGFVEGDKEYHVHLLWRLPEGVRIARWKTKRESQAMFEEQSRRITKRNALTVEMTRILKQMVPSGDVVAYDLSEPTATLYAISYSVKGVHEGSHVIVGPPRTSRERPSRKKASSARPPSIAKS